MKAKALTVAAAIACFGAVCSAPALAQSTQGATGSGNATSTLKKDGGQNSTSGAAAPRTGTSGSGMKSSGGGMGMPGAPAGESTTGTTGNMGAAGGAGAGTGMGASGQGALKTTPGSMPASK